MKLSRFIGEKKVYQKKINVPYYNECLHENKGL